jgi:hypothetical protein
VPRILNSQGDRPTHSVCSLSETLLVTLESALGWPKRRFPVLCTPKNQRYVTPSHSIDTYAAPNDKDSFVEVGRVSSNATQVRGPKSISTAGADNRGPTVKFREVKSRSGVRETRVQWARIGLGALASRGGKSGSRDISFRGADTRARRGSRESAIESAGDFSTTTNVSIRDDAEPYARIA